jgi:putative transposase
LKNIFPNRKPTRHTNYDYNLPGYYFVTICSFGKNCLFGNINNGVMILNDIGEAVNKYWNEIPKHFENVELDYYQVMPNHLHGIIVIDSTNNIVGNAYTAFPVNNAIRHSGQAFAFPTDRTKMILSKVVQQFKRQVTIDIKTRFGFKENIWQKSFYDRIIRNENELYQIRKYIKQNPMRWDLEKNIPENLF